MTQWYYRRLGREHGPFTPKQFKELAATGQIQPTDEIRKDGMPAYVPGTRIEGLFPRTSVPPPEIAKPQVLGDADVETPRSRRRVFCLVAALGVAVGTAGAWWLWRHKEEPPVRNDHRR